MSRRSASSWVSSAVVLIAACLMSAAPAEGQYFGRNKVQHRAFDFHVMRTEHFDVYYYPEEEEATRDAARMAERWYARLSRILDHTFEERQPLILYAHHPDFQQTTVLSGEISDGTGGVTEAFKQRVVMPFASSYAETDHVLGHELVHAFQYDISGLGRAGGGIEAAAARFQVPLWFVEGMAEYLSVGPVHPLTANWLRNAALAGNLPTIRDLSRNASIFPYRYGHAVWAYIGGRWGDATIGQILKLTGEGVPFEQAFEQVLNITLDDLSGDWHAAVRGAYMPQLANRREARSVARPLITNENRGGRLNLSPALSPDGKHLAFLSDRSGMDVELLLADAETGEILRTLHKGAAFDAHVNSLRFIQSAGAWSPRGDRIAMSALAEGEDVLIILDVRGNRVAEHRVPGVGEISGPSWSPDGARIVFSGLAGGQSDLYLLDLATGESERLTKDRFGDVQPVFSPDGRRIAFATDRFGTDFESLTYGEYQLALFDLESRKIGRVHTPSGGDAINPQWAPGGEELFFVGNCTGVPNLYRVDLESRELRQVTNLFSGVSGITETSPALAVASAGERAVFTAFEDRGYNLYALTGEELAGETIAPNCASDRLESALLPPHPRPSEAPFNRVALALADVSTGLPSAAQALAFSVEEYRPRLSLDYLGQPQVGLSVGGPFGGVGLYGGITGIFSDLLGRHTVGAALQVQGQLDETGFLVQYLNTRRRLNFGFAAQRIPYVYAYYGSSGAGTQIVRQRFFDWAAQGFAQYPLSSVQRFELGAGVRRLSQDQQLYDLFYDPRTGSVELGNRQSVGGVSYNMFESSAAWVYDSSVFGYTAPIAGQRARVEISPMVGQLKMVSALADVRKYFHARPFTLAVRGLHYGRYGRDGEGVFSNLYLGSPMLLRGYDSSYNNCVTLGSECDVLNQLVGSRLAVASAELRVPLLTPSRDGGGFALPIEGIAFYDAGVAWTEDTRPTLARGIQADAGRRGLLTSVGFGARVNLFNYLVLEVDRVLPLEASGSWRWVFAIQPGF